MKSNGVTPTTITILYVVVSILPASFLLSNQHDVGNHNKGRRSPVVFASAFITSRQPVSRGASSYHNNNRRKLFLLNDKNNANNKIHGYGGPPSGAMDQLAREWVSRNRDGSRGSEASSSSFPYIKTTTTTTTAMRTDPSMPPGGQDFHNHMAMRMTTNNSNNNNDDDPTVKTVQGWVMGDSGGAAAPGVIKGSGSRVVNGGAAASGSPTGAATAPAIKASQQLNVNGGVASDGLNGGSSASDNAPRGAASVSPPNPSAPMSMEELQRQWITRNRDDGSYSGSSAPKMTTTTTTNVAAVPSIRAPVPSAAVPPKPPVYGSTVSGGSGGVGNGFQSFSASTTGNVNTAASASNTVNAVSSFSSMAELAHQWQAAAAASSRSALMDQPVRDTTTTTNVNSRSTTTTNDGPAKAAPTSTVTAAAQAPNGGTAFVAGREALQKAPPLAAETSAPVGPVSSATTPASKAATSGSAHIGQAPPMAEWAARVPASQLPTTTTTDTNVFRQPLSSALAVATTEPSVNQDEEDSLGAKKEAEKIITKIDKVIPRGGTPVKNIVALGAAILTIVPVVGQLISLDVFQQQQQPPLTPEAKVIELSQQQQNKPQAASVVATTNPAVAPGNSDATKSKEATASSEEASPFSALKPFAGAPSKFAVTRLDVIGGVPKTPAPGSPVAAVKIDEPSVTVAPSTNKVEEAPKPTTPKTSADQEQVRPAAKMETPKVTSAFANMDAQAKSGAAKVEELTTAPAVSVAVPKVDAEASKPADKVVESVTTDAQAKLATTTEESAKAAVSAAAPQFDSEVVKPATKVEAKPAAASSVPKADEEVKLPAAKVEEPVKPPDSSVAPKVIDEPAAKVQVKPDSKVEETAGPTASTRQKPAAKMDEPATANVDFDAKQVKVDEPAKPVVVAPKATAKEADASAAIVAPALTADVAQASSTPVKKSEATESTPAVKIEEAKSVVAKDEPKTASVETKVDAGTEVETRKAGLFNMFSTPKEEPKAESAETKDAVVAAEAETRKPDVFKMFSTPKEEPKAESDAVVAAEAETRKPDFFKMFSTPEMEESTKEKNVKPVETQAAADVESAKPMITKAEEFFKMIVPSNTEAPLESAAKVEEAPKTVAKVEEASKPAANIEETKKAGKASVGDKVPESVSDVKASEPEQSVQNSDDNIAESSKFADFFKSFSSLDKASEQQPPTKVETTTPDDMPKSFVVKAEDVAAAQEEFVTAIPPAASNALGNELPVFQTFEEVMSQLKKNK